MSRIAAVILAGGRGERLGGIIKANLHIGGVSLLARARAALGLEVAPVLIACGAIDPGRLELKPGQIAIPDLVSDYAGPLAGVAAAVDWLLRQAQVPEFLITLAVDTPFAPTDLASGLKAALPAGESGILAGYGGQAYPTNALWRFESLTGLPEGIAAGTAPRSLKRLAAELGATVLDWPVQAGGDPFASVNTPLDLHAANARTQFGLGK